MDFLSQLKENANRRKTSNNNTISSSVEATPQPIMQSSPSAKDVIIRTMMQKIVFKIYPNGNVYIDKNESRTWITETKSVFKKKVVKKADSIQKVEVEDVEEW